MNVASNELHEMVVLRSIPYREYDLLLELFTQKLGRVSAIASGARRPKSSMKAIIQPFNLIVGMFKGKGDLKRVISVELKVSYSFIPQVSFCALYLNEILFYLLERNIPQPNIFSNYLISMDLLQKTDLYETEPLLRIFELNLLNELGYGIDFSADTKGNSICEDQSYIYDPNSGFVSVMQFDNISTISGRVIKKMGRRDFSDLMALKNAKRICQQTINVHLGNHRLMSRDLLRKFMTYKREI